MAEELTPIENVRPGSVLGQDIVHPKTKEVVYTKGIRLTADMINNILSLDYLKIQIGGEDSAFPAQASRLPTRKFKIGDYICFQGEIAKSIYILKVGVLQVLATEEIPPQDSLEKARVYVNENGKVITTIKGTGTKFGEMAAILNGTRNASIKCLTEAEVVEISTDEKTFKRTVINNSQLGLALCATLATRLRKVRSSVNEVEKLYNALISKLLNYREIYNRIITSLRRKEGTSSEDWMAKIVREASSLPPLSDAGIIRKDEVERVFHEFDFREDSLPAELESYLGINTTLCRKGEKQTEFFILKKGKIETMVNDRRVNLYSTSGEMIHFLDPLILGKKFQGIYPDTLKCISPVRAFRLNIEKLEDTCRFHPKLALFLCKALSQYINQENEYLLHLQDSFESWLNRIAIGDCNFRRAYKKLSRILEKFTKEPNATAQELEIAKNVMYMIDQDFAGFKERLNKIHLSSSN